VHQVSFGNIHSTALCVDQGTKETMIIQMGIYVMPLEEHEEEANKQNLMRNEDLKKLQDIPSIPFAIDFSIPISKLECGDGFSAILTAEG
jgi:alpha-tubulin suppressor-like RCC1 family protein